MADSHANSNRSFKSPRPCALAHAPAQVPAPGSGPQAGEPNAHVNLERCRLSLIKGEHRWRFRWEPGSEAAVISAVADLARNPHMSFDWFDAAVVCRHIAQGLPSRDQSTSTIATESPSTSVGSPRQK